MNPAGYVFTLLAGTGAAASIDATDANASVAGYELRLSISASGGAQTSGANGYAAESTIAHAAADRHGTLLGSAGYELTGGLLPASEADTPGNSVFHDSFE